MISYFILVFQFLSLSFWIGGSTVLLFFAAPIVSKNLLQYPDVLAMTGSMIKRFSSMFILNTVLLGITLYLQMAFLSHGIFFRLRIAMTFVSLAIMIAAYHRFVLTPALERLRAPKGEVPPARENNEIIKLQSLHHRRAILFSVNLLLGVAVVMTLLFPVH